MIPAIIILSLVVAGQQWFWSRQVQKLIDKIMSRNYAEYVQASAPPPAPSRIMVPEEREDLGALQGIQI